MNILKFFVGVSTIILILFFPYFAFAVEYKPLLVLDMQNAPKFPHHFRTTANHPDDQNINWQGLKDLNILGSSQFSKSSLMKILNYLHFSNLMVIDLRQESHGFLNGNAIGWYGFRNSENTGKSTEAIEADQTTHLNELGKDQYIIINKILARNANGGIEKTKPIEFAVHTLSSEEEFVKSLNLKYFRLYVQDFHAPNEEQVDRFIELVKELPKKNEWLYLHCRAGVGRTTTFMVMFDMMRNAKNVSFNNILARQAKIGGKNLKELPPPHNFKSEYAKQRLAFLHLFYEYARQNNDNFKTSWTIWLKGHAPT